MKILAKIFVKRNFAKFRLIFAFRENLKKHFRFNPNRRYLILHTFFVEKRFPVSGKAVPLACEAVPVAGEAICFYRQ